MKRIFVLLAAALMLTACAALPTSGPESLPTTSPQPLPAEEEEEPAAMTVGGQEIPLWAYRYWLSQACTQAAKLYEKGGQTPDWNGPLRQQVREQAMADAALCAVVDDWAVARSCDLTEADQGELDLLWADRAAAHGGEEAYLRSLADNGLTKSQARALAETGQRYRKLHEQAQDPTSPYAPSPEQLSVFAQQEHLLWADCITATGENAQGKIADIFSRLNAAKDPIAAFSALTKEGEDHTGVRLVRPGESSLPPALEQAAAELKPGQHSGILSTDGGYAILLRAAPDLSELTSLWLDSHLLEAAAAAPTTVLPALSSVPIPVQP